jgi:hypothetical protein
MSMRTTAQALGLILAAAAPLALSACDKPKPRNVPPPAPVAAGAAAAPAPGGAGAMPALPEWSKDLIGKPIANLFPGDPTICTGNTDNVQQTYADGVQIVGWGWDPQAKAPIAHVLLVDTTGLVAGAGEAGLDRPDVPRAKPEVTSGKSGWAAYTSRTMGPIESFGVINGGKSVCRLGRLVY